MTADMRQMEQHSPTTLGSLHGCLTLGHLIPTPQFGSSSSLTPGPKVLTSLSVTAGERQDALPRP